MELSVSCERAVSISCLATASKVAGVLSVVVSVIIPPDGATPVVATGAAPSRAVPVIAASIAPGRTAAVSASIVVGLLVVPAPVVCEHRRTSFVEVIPVGVVAIDVESHMTGIPRKWTVEVRQCEVLIVLIDSQYKLKVGVSPVPPRAVEVVASVHAHQVVEIDFIDCVILVIRQVQFIGHLVAQEQGLVLSLGV